MIVPILPHLPKYFSHAVKKQLGEFYVAITIADFAVALMILFEPIYFVVALGWDLTKILLFFAAVYFFYILFVPYGAALASKKGYKHALVYNIPFQVGYWLMLFYLPGHEKFVIVAAAFLAMQKAFFWPAFQAELARFSDSDQRGRESSLAWSIASFTYIIGPFIGGFISENFGVRALLIVAAAVYFTMFIPIFASPDAVDKKPYRFRDTLSYYRRFPREGLVYAGFGEELVMLAAWPVFIFSLVPDFMDLGLLVAGATLFATLVMLYVGKIVDKGESRQSLKLGVTGSIVAWLSRFLISTAGAVFIVDSLLRITRNLFFIPITKFIYDRANDEKIMAYVVFFEQTLSIGKLAAALAGALVFYLTESYGAVFVLAAAFTLLYLFLPFKTKISLQGNILKAGR